jgi:DNA modification methylase
MTPYRVMGGGEHHIYCGNAYKVLQQMEAGSVHCAVTSPPYFPVAELRHLPGLRQTHCHRAVQVWS